MKIRIAILLIMLVALAVPAFSQVNITFAWDASASPSTPTHPISYRLHVCSNEALTNCTPTEAGQALEKAIQLGADSQNWVYVVAYWDAVEGQPGAGIVESGKSNVLSVRIFSPPASPGNSRIKIVSVAYGADGQATLVARIQ